MMVLIAVRQRKVTQVLLEHLTLSLYVLLGLLPVPFQAGSRPTLECTQRLPVECHGCFARAIQSDRENTVNIEKKKF